MPRAAPALASALVLVVLVAAFPTAAADPCMVWPSFQTMPCVWQTTRATEADAEDATFAVDAHWERENAALEEEADAAPDPRAGEILEIGRVALNATVPHTTAHARHSSAALVDVAYAEYLWTVGPSLNVTFDAITAGEQWASGIASDAHRAACEQYYGVCHLP